MDTRNANISEGRTAAAEPVNKAIEERLNELLTINAEIVCRKSSNFLTNEELAAEIMLHPISLDADALRVIEARMPCAILASW